ncbi:hypothetical protein [Kitasatospora sp. NPDC085879]|uniref:hypothetical protein n=1 Tax=Kitasatospora sp. NPDC085879 TaxID=3154769 RepID=UPI0034320097
MLLPTVEPTTSGPVLRAFSTATTRRVADESKAAVRGEFRGFLVQAGHDRLFGCGGAVLVREGLALEDGEINRMQCQVVHLDDVIDDEPG